MARRKERLAAECCRLPRSVRSAEQVAVSVRSSPMSPVKRAPVVVVVAPAADDDHDDALVPVVVAVVVVVVVVVVPLAPAALLASSCHSVEVSVDQPEVAAAKPLYLHNTRSQIQNRIKSKLFYQNHEIL